MNKVEIRYWEEKEGIYDDDIKKDVDFLSEIENKWEIVERCINLDREDCCCNNMVNVVENKNMLNIKFFGGRIIIKSC